jgi:hypothetical protein
MVPSYKTHSKRQVKRGTGQVIQYFLSHGPLMQDSLAKRTEEVYRKGRPFYNVVLSESLPKRIEEEYRTLHPSFHMVASYKTHSQRELKRATGHVVLIITWSSHRELTPKEI